MSIILIKTLALVIASSLGFWIFVQIDSLANEAGKIRFIPPPPPNRGAPQGRSRGGASRGSCGRDSVPLTALVPITQETFKDNSESVWGLTLLEHPTFLFYVPYTTDAVLEFVLQDEQHNILYKTAFKMSDGKSGIIKISLPKNTYPLKLGKLYRWYFLVYCNKNDPVFVEGWIERIALNSIIQTQLQQKNLKEQINVIAAQGIWYDTVAKLAELRQTNPDNNSLAIEWENLLNSVGLGAIASEPLLLVVLSPHQIY